jgi:hypothetical protein
MKIVLIRACSNGQHTLTILTNANLKLGPPLNWTDKSNNWSVPDLLVLASYQPLPSNFFILLGWEVLYYQNYGNVSRLVFPGCTSMLFSILLCQRIKNTPFLPKAYFHCIKEY